MFGPIYWSDERGEYKIVKRNPACIAISNTSKRRKNKKNNKKTTEKQKQDSAFIPLNTKFLDGFEVLS